MEFEKALLTPELWFQKSWQLFESSKVLYESLVKVPSVGDFDERALYRKVGSMNSSMLLMGLSVENALKGFHISQTLPDISNGKISPKHFVGNGKSHELIKIAKHIGFQLSPEQKLLLERLTHFVSWAAKYNSALDKNTHDSAKGNLLLKSPTDFVIAENLIKKLQNQAGYDENKGWPVLR
ncbi:TPA: hypothetical protein I7784_22240 [Vibrio vulnificus]|uniref:hypothetical protein n=1 Tax=Vibrio vulnificus TaxID=672 RepID=UPI00102C7C83|nr:hypothetical protein [Vibrio vulnificus]RZQ89804.1 hypothetical protein D8T23_22240 [Vibrio vulnificus]HAS6083178.1 hypothetical protein [Vibrio vulnificus]HAS8622983.1 hypothetical protein [Vibrio vulnificus]